MNAPLSIVELPTFLPGKLLLRDGRFEDYRALGAFHYLAPKPATISAIATIDWQPSSLRGRAPARPIAVAVLSWPVPSNHARESALGREHFSRKENLCFANQHVRTISRVIVHPQFRAIGLSSLLIRRLCEQCNTRYVEAMATMGSVVPLFTRAGFSRVPVCLDRPRSRGSNAPYFLLDRDPADRDPTATPS